MAFLVSYRQGHGLPLPLLIFSSSLLFISLLSPLISFPLLSSLLSIPLLSSLLPSFPFPSPSLLSSLSLPLPLSSVTNVSPPPSLVLPLFLSSSKRLRLFLHFPFPPPPPILSAVGKGVSQRNCCGCVSCVSPAAAVRLLIFIAIPCAILSKGHRMPTIILFPSPFLCLALIFIRGFRIHVFYCRNPVFPGSVSVFHPWDSGAVQGGAVRTPRLPQSGGRTCGSHE